MNSTNHDSLMSPMEFKALQSQFPGIPTVNYNDMITGLAQAKLITTDEANGAFDQDVDAGMTRFLPRRVLSLSEKAIKTLCEAGAILMFVDSGLMESNPGAGANCYVIPLARIEGPSYPAQRLGAIIFSAGAEYSQFINAIGSREAIDAVLQAVPKQTHQPTF